MRVCVGLVLPSSEEKLRLSGVPVGVMPGSKGAFDLVVNFMIVSTPDKRVIDSKHEARIALSDEWYQRVEDGLEEESGQEVVFDLELEKPDPENKDDMALQKVLTEAGMSIYKITGCRYEQNPRTAYN